MKDIKSIILISLLLLLILNNTCGQDMVKQLYFEMENKIIIYDIQSGEWTELFSRDNSEYFFFDQQSGKTVLRRDGRYYFVEIDRSKKEYKIIKRVPDNLAYTQEGYRPFALKKMNSTNDKVAYFTRVKNGYVDLQIDNNDGTNLTKLHFDNAFEFYWLKGDILFIVFDSITIGNSPTLIMNVKTGERQEKKEYIVNVVDYGNYIFQITNNVDAIELLDKNGTVIFTVNTLGDAYKIGDYIVILQNTESIYQDYKLVIYNIQTIRKIFEKKEFNTNLRFIGFE